MTLFQALRILAECHTREDPERGFVVEMGVTSPRWHAQADYVEAWRVVREQLSLQTKPA